MRTIHLLRPGLAVLPVLLTGQPPVLELDHVYIVVPPGAVEAVGTLRRIGMMVDTGTTRHEGEGTASVAVFFENAYLELLWVDSSVVVDAAHVVDAADFRRAAAWRETGASPFGIGLHLVSGDASILEAAGRLDPIPGAEPPASYVLLRQPGESLAPDVFVMPAARAVTVWLSRYRTRHPERFMHRFGGRKITRVLVRGPPAQRPHAADLTLRGVRFREADTPLLVVEFDGGTGGESWDLRPALPLVLRR